MKEYTIAKREYSKDVWNTVEELYIDTYRWMTNGYEPKVSAKLFHDGENIYIKFQAEENEITIKHFNMQEDVYKDSCVEFFFRTPSKDTYFNMETNALGVVLLGLGDNGDERERINPDFSIFGLTPSVSDPEKFQGPFWTLEYKIPFSFIKEYLKDFDIKDGIFANCYKCGDETRFEHYGMWNEVENETPKFHKPEFFGRMYFEL